MKKIVLIAFILISGFCANATHLSDTTKKDTAKAWVPKDNKEEFISIEDILNIKKDLGDKISLNDGEKMVRYFDLLINAAVERKRKKKN